MFIFTASITAFAQGLPRHGVIGLSVGLADQGKAFDAQSNPVTVLQPVPGGPAAAAGLQPGDVIRKLDDVAISAPDQFAALVGRHLGGDSVRITVNRNGQEIVKTAVLKPRPFETSSEFDVLYRAVSVDGSRRRVIVTKPKGTGRFPAILLIGGLGCYSLDGEPTDSGYGRILSGLTRKGFVTMRVEKTGEGDSEGPLCTDLKADAHLEAAGYLAGLRALKGYEFVDPQRVFIFAHSMGPLIGSLIIPQEPVRGFIAVETIGRSWFEYELENARRQFALTGDPLDKVDEEVRQHEKCAHRFYVEKQTPADIIKSDPGCKDAFTGFGAVPYTYMQQVADINLPRQWRQVNVPVLVIYGTSSPVTSASESRYLADTINSFHPGGATYVEIPGMGHDFNLYSSPREFMNRRNSKEPHPFAPALLETVSGWLGNQLRMPAQTTGR